ncbi:putative transmembrane domain-containing protein [Neospora caninum Liverpool]|uniref:Putative transmembrane domain-containing protein n=1 Tax=Neospora caninum (strain Liverpool) TaxID=572307 RepID=F0VA31_NEOCL|nr:putative transmembrane domain-containing protein [Neospora caninum Liverpool]CBZ50520.1 putative transmembrane domain-containing protein [Neospora caninum Liverpool]CEL65130.1 TPA: transmembrane domain-containing protein,putative [Neospora caninum Liverpool]|eukprot:XP_003880553.1 putative transmembrane domain-containing protein [Neospora caninum Liverpool]
MARSLAGFLFPLFFCVFLAAPVHAGPAQSRRRPSPSKASTSVSVLETTAPACLRCSAGSHAASVNQAHEVVSSFSAPPADPARCELYLQNLFCALNCSAEKAQPWVSVRAAPASSGVSFAESKAKVSTTVRVCSQACEQFGAACQSAGSAQAPQDGGASFVEKTSGVRRPAHRGDAGRNEEDAPGFLQLHTKHRSRASAKAKRSEKSCVDLKLAGLAFVSVDQPAAGHERAGTQGDAACLSFLQVEQPADDYTAEQTAGAAQAPPMTRTQPIAEHDQLADPSTLVPGVPLNPQPADLAGTAALPQAYPDVPLGPTPATVAPQDPSGVAAGVAGAETVAPTPIPSVVPAAAANPASPTLASVAPTPVSSPLVPASVAPTGSPAAVTGVPDASLPEAPAFQAQPVVTPQAQPVVTPQAQPAVSSEAQPVVTPQAQPVVTPQTQPVVTPQAQPVVTPQAQPAVSSQAQPAVSSQAQPAVASQAQPVVASRAQPAATTVQAAVSSTAGASAATGSTVGAQPVGEPAPSPAAGVQAAGAPTTVSRRQAISSEAGAAGTTGASPTVAVSQGRVVDLRQGVKTTGHFREAQTLEVVPEDGFCMSNCECWPVWASAIVVFVVYLAATFIAIVMMASLFSRGLWSSTFYRGGGNWLIGSSVMGAVTGGLVGGLVTQCVAGGLGLAAGLMTLCCSILLVGRRGAWLGAMGGILTGAVVGAMINTGGFAIALGGSIGLLLGVICGFAPIARQLKVNERYIRQGMAAAAMAGNSGKKHPEGGRRGDGGVDHFRGYDPIGSGPEDSQRQSRPSVLGNMRSSLRSEATAGSLSARLRSVAAAHNAYTADEEKLYDHGRSVESDSHEFRTDNAPSRPGSPLSAGGVDDEE